MSPKKRRRLQQNPPGRARGGAHDLFVPIPPLDGDPKEQELHMNELLDRFETTGYSTIAWTQTVFGRPPDELKQQEVTVVDTFKEKRPRLTMLKRLHVVMENLSDMAAFVKSPTTKTPPASWQQSYDLISIVPKNQAVFEAAMDSCCDILTLDPHARLKIQNSHFQTMEARKIALEIIYAPAILSAIPSSRRVLVQACRNFGNVLRRYKSRPNIICSSGERQKDGEDAGVMALRMPGDIENLLQTVFGFLTPHEALFQHARRILEYAQQRRYGAFVEAAWDTKEEDPAETSISKTKVEESRTNIEQGTGSGAGLPEKDSSPTSPPQEDGFITL